MEGRGKFLYFSIMSVMQWFEGHIKITIMYAIYFSADLRKRYKNNENLKIVIK